jgi:hypothetical protein
MWPPEHITHVRSGKNRSNPQFNTWQEFWGTEAKKKQLKAKREVKAVQIVLSYESIGEVQTKGGLVMRFISVEIWF